MCFFFLIIYSPEHSHGCGDLHIILHSCAFFFPVVCNLLWDKFKSNLQFTTLRRSKPPVCTHKSLLLPNPWQPKHPFPRRFPLSYETLVFSPCRTSCISPWDRSLTWSSSLTLLWEGWTKGGWNSVFLVCYALLNYSHRLKKKKIKWCNGHRYQRLCFITACNFKSVIEPRAVSAKTDSWDDRWGLVA